MVLLGCEGKSAGTRGHDTAIATGIAASSTTSSTPAAAMIETPPPSVALVTTPWVDVKQVFDTSLDAPNFQCAPRQFTNRDTIILRAEVPHGGQLSVSAPDSTNFYLVFPPDWDKQSVTLMPTDTFANALITRFRGDIRGRPRVYGRDTLEPIFRKPGRYTFFLASNLATDYDTDEEEDRAVWKCTITLLPER
jgi:hypothetical protein